MRCPRCGIQTSDQVCQACGYHFRQHKNLAPKWLVAILLTVAALAAAFLAGLDWSLFV